MMTKSDFDAMLESGELNPYMYKWLTSLSFGIFDESARQMAIEEAPRASALGVSNREELVYFYKMTEVLPQILKDMFRNISDKHVRDIEAIMMKDPEHFPLGPQLVDAWYSVAEAASLAGLSVDEAILNNIKVRRDGFGKKLAYPAGFSSPFLGNTYNIRRWINATRDIYSRTSLGTPANVAFEIVTSNWGKMEKIDFKHWMRFYQEGAHEKYKIARSIPSNEGGYYLPTVSREDLRSDLPMPWHSDAPVPPPPPQEDNDVNEARMTIETQRSRIISRLNSAEKLLASLEGQFFAGDDQDYMLKLLQDLKRKVQTANKIRVRSSLFEDLIFRTANMLKSQGNRKAAALFYKIAQPAPPGGDLLSGMIGGSPMPPVPGERPDMGGGGAGSGSKEDTRKAFREFFELLQTGVADLTEEDEVVSPMDIPNAAPPAAPEEAPEAAGAPPGAPPAPGGAPPEDEVEVEVPEVPQVGPPGATASYDPYAEIVVTAQDLAPPDEPIEAELPAEPASPEVAEDERANPAEELPAETSVERVDDAIESALRNVTVRDVVNRLELLSGLFKKREIARQLAIVDMMMDRLGIGTFFPSLGEATRSALESNQYVATRIEDVLSKLRGSIESERAEQALQTELVEPSPTPPGVEGVKQSLEEDAAKEKDRKEKRRQQEEAKLNKAQEATEEGGVAPTPEAPAPEPELGGPAERIERGRPLPIR